MNHISNDINSPTTLQLIAAAIQHLKAEGVAASITPLPGIGKYVTVGTPVEVARLLEIAPGVQVPPDVRDQARDEGLKEAANVLDQLPRSDASHGPLTLAAAAIRALMKSGSQSKGEGEKA